MLTSVKPLVPAAHRSGFSTEATSFGEPSSSALVPMGSGVDSIREDVNPFGNPQPVLHSFPKLSLRSVWWEQLGGETTCSRGPSGMAETWWQPKRTDLLHAPLLRQQLPAGWNGSTPADLPQGPHRDFLRVPGGRPDNTQASYQRCQAFLPPLLTPQLLKLGPPVCPPPPSPR